MRFRKGEHYPHPPRGPGRGLYRMSDAARRARRQNLARSHTRSNRETLVIKLLIWQSSFDDKRANSQRSLARQLGVSPSYVCKIQAQAEKGLDALARGTVSLLMTYTMRAFSPRNSDSYSRSFCAFRPGQTLKNVLVRAFGRRLKNGRGPARRDFRKASTLLTCSFFRFALIRGNEIRVVF